MSVLSLMARTPSPEPVEKDFYSEFANRRTGTKLLTFVFSLENLFQRNPADLNLQIPLLVILVGKYSILMSPD